jgi:hypothetical protein
MFAPRVEPRFGPVLQGRIKVQGCTALLARR